MAVGDKLGLAELRSAKESRFGAASSRPVSLPGLSGGLSPAGEPATANLPAALLFEASPTGAALVDDQDRILAANAALQTLLGWAQSELRGRRMDSLHGGSGLAAPGGSPYTCLFRRDGEPLWVRLSGVALEPDASGAITRVIFVHDRTEETKLAGELEASLTRFRQLADHIDDGFLLLSPDLREVIHASPAAHSLWSARVGGEVGEQLDLDALHPDDRREFLAKSEEVLHQRVDVAVRLVDGQGGVCASLHVRLLALPDSSGRTRQVAALLTDVTARKQVAEVLAHARQHAARLVQAIPDPQGALGVADSRSGRASGLSGAMQEDAGRAERRVFASLSATLTPREREVMELLVAGGTTKSIAAGLSLSPKTVEVHRARVMKKMKAPSLAELVRLVVLGQLPLPSGA